MAVDNQNQQSPRRTPSEREPGRESVRNPSEKDSDISQRNRSDRY